MQLTMSLKYEIWFTREYKIKNFKYKMFLYFIFELQPEDGFINKPHLI